MLTGFPHKHGPLALSVDVLKEIPQKMKSPNVYKM